MSSININGAEIYYQDHGKGFPVVFSHGLGSDHTMWINQIEAFKKQYRVIVWDVRGHGKSEVTENGYSIGNFVTDLNLLMKHLEIDRAHIVGLSMGGWISWSFALTHPEKTAGLVLSDSAGYHVGMSQKMHEQAKNMFTASAQVAEKHGRAKMVDVTLSLMFSEKFIQNNPEIIKIVAQRISEDRGIGYARAIMGAFKDYWGEPDKSVTESLGKIKAETLVIAGDEDKLTPLPTQKGLSAAIPGSRLEIITGSGHVPPIEKPDIWNGLVLEFLEKIDHK